MSYYHRVPKARSTSHNYRCVFRPGKQVIDKGGRWMGTPDATRHVLSDVEAGIVDLLLG